MSLYFFLRTCKKIFLFNNFLLLRKIWRLQERQHFVKLETHVKELCCIAKIEKHITKPKKRENTKNLFNYLYYYGLKEMNHDLNKT